MPTSGGTRAFFGDYRAGEEIGKLDSSRVSAGSKTVLAELRLTTVLNA